MFNLPDKHRGKAVQFITVWLHSGTKMRFRVELCDTVSDYPVCMLCQQFRNERKSQAAS